MKIIDRFNKLPIKKQWQIAALVWGTIAVSLSLIWYFHHV